MHSTHMPTARWLVGGVAISAGPHLTLTVVVAVEVVAQANEVVAPPGVAMAGVAEAMDVHAQTLLTSTSPTPTATLHPRNGKRSVQCALSYCKWAKVAAVVAADGMTIDRSPTAPHNALPAWSR